MNIYDYDSYQEYIERQVSANKRKIGWIWVQKENIKKICDFIGHADSVLCHGTRRGKEQQYFKEFLGCEVLGTEISPTATDFPDTIQWDFNKENPDWEKGWDIVYSNSLDHSPTPKETVGLWMSQARKYLILERDDYCNTSTEFDPFGATEKEWEAMFPIKQKIKGNKTTIYVL